MKYKISIIIPVYNAEEFIIDTLSSIENQTMDFEDIEVILVNDCSSDNTKNIINNYAEDHENIVPLHLKDNAGGPAIPRNIGMTYASADYLMFLDQDDVFRENACEVLYEKIVQNNVDMVCGNHNMVHNGKSNLCFNFDWAESDEIKIDNIHENPNFLTMGVAAWSKIFRKDFVLNNNLKFTEGVGEDIFFSIRSLLLAKGIILLKNFAVVDYQIRDESLSHQVDYDYVIEFCDFYSKFLNYCLDNNISEELYLPLFNGRMNNLLSILFYPNLKSDELTNIFQLVQTLFLQLNKKQFYFYNNLYQLFYECLIEDNYPFNQSISTYEFVKKSRSNQIQRELLNKAHTCAIYIDTGDGFNEKNRINKFYEINECSEIIFNTSDFNNIKNIRFDPIEGYYVFCHVDKISSNNGEFSFIPINSIDSNENEDIFLTKDAQYSLEGDFESLEYIKIKFITNTIDNSRLNKIINKNIFK